MRKITMKSLQKTSAIGTCVGAARRAWTPALCILALALGGAPAEARDEIPPPKYAAVDANGVDLISGGAMVGRAINSIGGQGPGGLTVSDSQRGGNMTTSLRSYVKLLNVGGSEETNVIFMGGAERFFGDPYVGAYPAEGTRGALTMDATDFIYTLADGTVARFMKVGPINPQKPQLNSVANLKNVVYPTGEILSFSHPPETTGFVESSLGYALIGGNFNNAANLKQGSCTVSGCSGPVYTSQQDLARSLTGSSAVIGGNVVFTVTDPAGGAARTYTITSFKVGAATQRVTSYTDGTGTWPYSYSDTFDPGVTVPPNDGLVTTTVTDPLGNMRVVTSRRSNQHIISDTQGKTASLPGHTTTFQYTGDSLRPGEGMLYQITAPEQNRTRWTYDDRLNVTSRQEAAKGSTAFVTKVEAGYEAGCANIKTCNKPLWVKDARGAQTDFTYDPVHGGVLTVTKPAPVVGGVRPQTRYIYGQFTARYYKGGVLMVAAPVWRVTQTSTCATLATCAGAADELVTSYSYEASSGANNVRLLSTTTRAGDNSLSVTTSYTYNDRGDVIAVDGPLAGTADTTRSYYDASRWKIGEIGPDPDGPGPLLYRASRTTYDNDGRVTLVETGTATSQLDGAMSSFVPLAFTRKSYGPTGQLVKVEAGQP